MEITILSLLVLLIGLVLFVMWAVSFKRSFTPDQGEYYVLSIFGKHLFTICVSDDRFAWYQRLAFYLLFWPFNIASLMYEWVEEMTYSDFLKKQDDGMNVRIDWKPDLPDDAYDADGHPLNKNIKILVARKERMRSLKGIEGFSFAAEFETKDGYRGHRIFTLFLKINDMSKVISKIHNWQRAATLSFNNEFNAWSKKVTYIEFRQTTMDRLKLALGVDKNQSFLEELNAEIEHLGYTIDRAQAGMISPDKDTLDLLESQELEAKALNRLQAANLETKEIEKRADAAAYEIEKKGQATAKALKEKGLAEAANLEQMALAEAKGIREKGTAEVVVLEKKSIVAKDLVQSMNKAIVEQTKAKFGTNGIGGHRGLTGVYIEKGGSEDISNPAQIVNHLVADIITQKQKEVEND